MVLNIRNRKRLMCRRQRISSLPRQFADINCRYCSLISNLNLQLSSRIRNTVEEKKRLVSALKANVSEEGQNLFIWLGKMLTSTQGKSCERRKICSSISFVLKLYILLVKWSGPDIVVFNDVFIRAPYRVENVEVLQPGKQRELDYVKKLLNRQQQNSSATSSSASSSESSSSKN